MKKEGGSKVGKLAASGISGNKGAKGIKHGHQGRNLQDTEHHDRMEHEIGEHSAFPSGEQGLY